MSAAVALTLYPVWALAVLMGITVLRLGRRTPRGLVALCLMLAAWVSLLVLARMPATAALAERLIPSGMLLGGAIAHAAHDLFGRRIRWLVLAHYLFGAMVAAAGAAAPWLLYAPGMGAPGPLFWPLVAVSTVLGAAMFAWVARAARGARGAERRRHLVFAGGQICATLGGGGAVAGHVLAGLPLEAAAPPVLGAVLLVAYAIVSGERGRSRRLLAQALIYAVFTAALSAVGLTVFFALLPSLLPPGGSPTAWLLVVFFFAALPLDPLRTLLVERLGQRLYPDPIGTRDLVDEVDRSRARADAAEHLAEIGTLASAVAHEIRNPLGVIAAHAKLLERAGADPDSVAALRAEVDRARRFLGDLLKFSQPRPLELGAVVVADALAASITAVRHAAGDAALPPITFDATSAGAAELVIDADPAAFRDVAVVLLENAVAALAGAGAGNGAGNRNGSTGAVRVAARPAGDVTEVIVEDDGPGVPPEIEPRLFQPFVTGRGRDARHPGTGLGLATAARWLERHGGEIRHERPPAGGARFVVRWPTRSRIHG